MRVTANMFPDRLSGQLATISARQNRLQEQAATGQRITRPDDDPGAMRRVLDLPEIARRLVDLGIETMPGTPEQMRTFVAAESAKWGRLVRELGMTMD